jgi:hypothetical protein
VVAYLINGGSRVAEFLSFPHGLAIPLQDIGSVKISEFGGGEQGILILYGGPSKRDNYHFINKELDPENYISICEIMGFDCDIEMVEDPEPVAAKSGLRMV